MTKAAFLLLSFFLVFPAQADQPFRYFSYEGAAHGSGGESIALPVMSYNVKGLPSFLLGGQYLDARFPLIARLLTERDQSGSGPALVLLQEAFSEESMALKVNPAFPHVAEGPAATSVLGVGSGLFILSRYPIEEAASLAFGPDLCLSWDCFSNKGVQFARIRIPGLPRPLEVFNTHLQAGRSDTPTRRRQVAVLLEFFRSHHREGNPVIFGGDFNFRPGLGQESYRDFAKGTGLAHAGKFCLESGCAQDPDTGWHGIWERAVDHQFYSSSGEVEIVPLLVERSYRHPFEGMKLSDHPAHEVRFELRVRPESRKVAAEDSGKVK